VCVTRAWPLVYDKSTICLNGFSCHLASMGRKHNLKSIRTGFSHSGTSDMFCLFSLGPGALHCTYLVHLKFSHFHLLTSRRQHDEGEKDYSSIMENVLTLMNLTHRVTQKVTISSGQLCVTAISSATAMPSETIIAA
jgi:hypothetical protein